MATVSHLFMPDTDFEYGGRQVWEVMGYRPSRFRSMAGDIAVLVKFLDGDKIWAWASDLNVKTERDCDFEFGEHEHDDDECARILDVMQNGYGEPDHSRDGWYDYDAGLRWSDFVEGPIGD